MPNAPETATDRLLKAILPHVAFDGWSPTSLAAAISDVGLTEAEAKAVAPRGAIDLAVAFHRAGDRAMLDRLAAADLSEMRFRDKVAAAIKFRVEAMEDREAVRRASALFALPQNAPEGAKLVWETADHIWKALGDTSQDVNWYTKRATLSGVWASTVLYWLGDQSPENADTYAFIDRRIDNVMQIEKAKAGLRKNPLTKPFMDLQSSVLSRVRAPDPTKLDNLPGRRSRPN